MGEHLLCKQGVVGSIPSSSTRQRTGPGDVSAARESRSKRQRVLFASGFLNQCYRLFFNNAEEVKQILLDGQGRKRKLSSRRVERDGLDCIDPRFP